MFPVPHFTDKETKAQKGVGTYFLTLTRASHFQVSIYIDVEERGKGDRDRNREIETEREEGREAEGEREKGTDCPCLRAYYWR